MGEIRILSQIHQYLLPFGFSAPARLALLLLFSNLYFYLPFYVLYLQDKGLNLVQISELSILLLLSNLLFEIPGGLLADHLSKKKILVIGLLLQLLGEIIFLQGTQFFHFALASFIGGIHCALHSGCLEAYLHELLDRQKKSERYSEALGYFGFAKSTANFIAFLGGSLIVGIWGPESFYILIALTIFCVGLALLGMFSLPWESIQLEEGEETHKRASNFTWLDRIGFSEISSLSGTLIVMILLFCATQPFADSLLIMIQPFFEERGGEVALLGLLTATGMAIEGLVLKQVHVLQNRFGVARILAGTLLFLGVGYVLLSWSVNAWMVAFFFLWIRSVVGVKQVLLTDQTLKIFPVHRHATVLSIMNLGSRLYVASGMWGIALVAEYSIPWAFMSLAGILLVATLLMIVIKIPQPISSPQFTQS
ncbi:MAG: MFS transporter [Proteobacteria bacterium]|nr:MAG: MFS transporter [Pseudomonadota bacterium]